VEADSRAVVRFQNERGIAEQWIKEGKQAIKMTRLSCHRFRSNEVRLRLSLIAYNLGNLWLRVGDRFLTSLQQRRLKAGGRLIGHARYYWLSLAEGYPGGKLGGRKLADRRAVFQQGEPSVCPSPAGTSRATRVRPLTRARRIECFA